MPKAKPSQVFVHRIELQEKEREYLEALQAAQTIKNLAYAGTAVGATALGYLGYKTLHEYLLSGNDEPTFWNIFDKEAKEQLVQESKEKGAGRTLWRLFTTPVWKGNIF